MSTAPVPEYDEVSIGKPGDTGLSINLKRVLARAIDFWYLIALSLLVSMTIAFLVNRYTNRIFPVKASIIIRENEENVGAKFLYNNEIVNPYRNFFNEIYVMKSYPLLQEVMESLNFQVSIYSEGDIKDSEIYDPEFPIVYKILPGSHGYHGKAWYFRTISQESFELQRKSDSQGGDPPSVAGKFGDTVKINGLKLLITRRADISSLIDKTLTLSFTDPFALARRYSNNLKVGWAEQGASVVDLEILGPVPQKDVDFLNKFIERYQQYDIEKKNIVAVMAMRFLDGQLKVIGDSLRLFEDQVEAFKRRNIVTDISEETSRLYQKMLALEDQKFQYKLLDNYFTYLDDHLKSEKYDGIFTPASVGISDEVIAALVNQLIEEQSQVNMYSSRKGEGVDKMSENPALIAKLRRIAFLKADILKSIENSKQTQEINIKFISEQIKLVEQQLAKLPSTERELIVIQRNYTLQENLYNFLLQKRTEAGLSEASTTSDIVVVNPPLAGGSISPKVFQNYTFGLAFGLLLPLLIFVIAELVDNKVQSKEDIEQLTHVPIIGSVGHNKQNEVLIVSVKPRSAMAESFRALRSNLYYFTGNKEKLAIMVTSSLPGEGKSFTALNLASVFALADKKTIVVGADLRRPKLFNELELANDVGLSQYLSGMVDIDSIIKKTPVDNLWLVSAGPMPPNPSELLLKPSMQLFLNELKKRFDCIILDTPPLGFVTDAFVLAPYVDHTIFLVRQDFTPKQELIALEDFRRLGKLKQVSILFNDLRKSGLGYGNGGYGYGYGYGYDRLYYGTSTKKKSDGYYDD